MPSPGLADRGLGCAACFARQVAEPEKWVDEVASACAVKEGKLAQFTFHFESTKEPVKLIEQARPFHPFLAPAVRSSAQCLD